MLSKSKAGWERHLQLTTKHCQKPDYPEAYNNMGNALQERGRLEEALTAYNKALSIKPDYADAWSNGAVYTLEHWNKIDDLEIWLGKAFYSFDTIPADLSLLRAKLMWRKR